MAKRGFQITLNVLQVARLFMIKPSRRRCGYEVATTLGMHINTAYGILDSLEQKEWLSSMREPRHEQAAQLEPRHSLHSNSPRKLYRITGMGHEQLSKAFASITFSST